MTTASTLAADVATDVSEELEKRRLRRERTVRRVWITLAQIGLAAAVLAAWQWVPSIHWLASRTHAFDRFFISSPSLVADRLYQLTFGRQSATPMWSYAWRTMSTAVVGLAIGMIVGAALGLILGSSRMLSSILRPFVVAGNAMPRIALIPVVVLIVGPTFAGSVAVAVMVTFFVAFFNAYEGARTVTPQLIQNATILGASKARIMLHIRLPYVLGWTFAALPLAATFSIISVVTGDLLVGTPGLGRLLLTATTNVDATLTFVVVIILSVLGLLTVAVSDLITSRILHWWGK